MADECLLLTQSGHRQKFQVDHTPIANRARCWIVGSMHRAGVVLLPTFTIVMMVVLLFVSGRMSIWW
jgi:hypothetical protein